MTVRCTLMLLAFIFVLRAPAGSQSSGKYSELFTAVWSTVNENFYDPGFAGVDWEKARDKYSPEIPKVKNDAAFQLLASRMLQEIPVSHLHLRPPSEARLYGIGVRLQEIEGRRVVTEVASASDAARKGIRPGDVLLTAPEKISGELGTTVTVDFQSCDGRKSKIQAKREQVWWPPERPSLRWKIVQQAPGKSLGYLRAIRFDDDVAPLADAAMKDFRDTQAIIFDIRGNSGGNASYLRLTSYLFGEKPAFALLSRPYLQKLGRATAELAIESLPRVDGAYTTEAILSAFKQNGGAAAFYTQNPPDRIYTGKIIVLIDEDTGSAAEGFAWSLTSHPKATLIGRKTAGAVLGGENFELPYGWQLTVPTHAAWGPDGRLHRDVAVVPDEEVAWTYRDVCQQRDPDMVKALDIIAQPGSN